MSVTISGLSSLSFSFACQDVCGGKNCFLIENYEENDGPEVMYAVIVFVKWSSVPFIFNRMKEHYPVLVCEFCIVEALLSISLQDQRYQSS